MIERKEYLQKLIQWKDEQVIKVVTGMRRCGKSTLLMQYQDYLKSIGVEDDQIIAINFEDLEYEELCEYKVLYDYLKELSYYRGRGVKANLGSYNFYFCRNTWWKTCKCVRKLWLERRGCSAHHGAFKTA